MLRDVDGIPVVEVQGEIDLFNLQSLDVDLQSAAAKDVGAVIVSLADTIYFDSAVIHRLLTFRRQMSVIRQNFYLVQPKLEAAQRLLHITGLTGKNDRCASLEEALALAAQVRYDRERT
ncbi:MAG TPA: STAS domain-containing protein [Candidatus Acidoferrales bacterium]|nr:STAS domain-containing protein [Candidatus Acidoferrales bacterium]